jgi:hypothetical protein
MSTRDRKLADHELFSDSDSEDQVKDRGQRPQTEAQRRDIVLTERVNMEVSLYPERINPVFGY